MVLSICSHSKTIAQNQEESLAKLEKCSISLVAPLPASSPNRIPPSKNNKLLRELFNLKLSKRLKSKVRKWLKQALISVSIRLLVFNQPMDHGGLFLWSEVSMANKLKNRLKGQIISLSWSPSLCWSGSKSFTRKSNTVWWSKRHCFSWKSKGITIFYAKTIRNISEMIFILDNSLIHHFSILRFLPKLFITSLSLLPGNVKHCMFCSSESCFSASFSISSSTTSSFMNFF